MIAIENEFGILDVRNAFEGFTIVRCNMCYAYYYDESGNPLDVSLLQWVWEVEDEEYVKGCGNCQTDAYLMDMESEDLLKLQLKS